ncbi:MAG TPA: hypothetical protein VHC47_10005 [Mucilaginibacter sp.]|nr:hypothetical protein [Mucilaginibacter sp.]
MKKIRMILLLGTMGGLITACHFRRHTTIIETGTNHYLRIESTGRVRFNQDETGIAYISWGGYLKYTNDQKKLEAENDGHGGIRYELYDGDEKLDPFGNGRQFIAEAVRVMIRKGYHSN